jgi:hypothetical protein
MIPEKVAKTRYDFTLYIKREGSGWNRKFVYSFTNFGGFSRNELLEALKLAAAHFESMDREEAQRLWGTTMPGFRPKPLGAN